MSYLSDHVHEVEVIVTGVVVARHHLVFIGPPGEVAVRHRSKPIEFHMSEAEPPTPPPSDWEALEMDDWDWEG